MGFKLKHASVRDSWSYGCFEKGDTRIRSLKEIKDRLTWRIEAWQKGEVKILLPNTVHDKEAKNSSRQDGNSPERQAKKFQAKMLKGDVRGAVKYLTKMDKGGVLLPGDIDENYGLTIKYFLQSKKHLCATTPPPSTLYPHDETTDVSNGDVTRDTID
jgi:hypothetical protein